MQYDAEAAAAAEQQRQLDQAAQQAQQQDRNALAAADAAYTPAWRQAGLPAKPLQFAADLSVLAGSQLLNPVAIIQQQSALQQQEVLQPPAVSEYCDKESDPHYFQATNNLKVRVRHAAAVAAAIQQCNHRAQRCVLLGLWA